MMETVRGECANCKGVDIEYGNSEPQDESYVYFYSCNDCEHNGRECYNLVYVGSD